MNTTKKQTPSLAELDSRTFDVVVVGGGIIGAATAREAAKAGYSVLLAEKSDFATGATSRSSRLLHCGLRYFETPKPFRTFAKHPGHLLVALRMARQAMQCRYEFVKSAPERVTGIEMLFPIYKNSHYLPWQIDLGFSLLSRMAPRDVPLNYRRLNRDKALAHPMCANLANKENLHSVAIFTEYQLVWPERICIDAILDAEELGAVALNYTNASIGQMDGDTRSVFLDQANGETAEVTGRRVMVMAGYWIDRILFKANPDTPPKSFGTKGAHIVIQLPENLRGIGMATVNSRGEPFYCIPQGDLHYIGPTETVYDGDPDTICCNEDDLIFLLEESRELFPGFNLGREDVIRTWAGVRPLTFDKDFPKGKRSRELHDLSTAGLSGVFAMTSAPIMTHRDAAREVVSKLKEKIAPSGAPKQIECQPHLPKENSTSPYLLQSKKACHLADVRTAVREEHSRHMDDVLYRRIGIGWRHFFTEDELAPIAEVMAEELNWTPEQKAIEISKFQEEVKELFGVPKP
jgi:glycerol-3-phosphate dehydrogenase